MIITILKCYFKVNEILENLKGGGQY